MEGGDSLLKGNKYVLSDSNNASHIVEDMSCSFDVVCAQQEQYQENIFLMLHELTVRRQTFLSVYLTDRKAWIINLKSSVLLSFYSL